MGAAGGGWPIAGQLAGRPVQFQVGCMWGSDLNGDWSVGSYLQHPCASGCPKESAIHPNEWTSFGALESPYLYREFQPLHPTARFGVIQCIYAC